MSNPTGKVSSLTKLMNEQKKSGLSPDSYNETITTTVSINTSHVDEDDELSDDHDDAYDPRKFLPNPTATTSTTTTNASSQSYSFQQRGGFHKSSPSTSSLYRSSFQPGSFSQLSHNIPYSAPGNNRTSISTGIVSTSFTNNNIPVPVNGQVITGNILSSPSVNANHQIESRFVVSKQKIDARVALSSSQTKSSSSLANFFSKSRRATSTNFENVSSSPIGYSNTPASHTNYEPHSPSSQSSIDSGSSSNTRHSSMADLRRFFKRSASISSAPQSPRVSNLSAGLSSQRQAPVAVPSSQGSGSAVPVTSNASNSNGISFKSPAYSNSIPIVNVDSSPKEYRRNLNGSSPGVILSTSANSLSTTPLSVGGNMTPQIPFSKRYIRFGESLGAGAGGQVKLIRRLADQKVFAVKEFRAKFTTESKRDYTKKITAEYCVGSTLKHPNIIETIEISFENDRLVQVMEYCDYDLFAIVMSNKMSTEEINCCFKQILNGVRYIHSIGLAHRDLKLDNCVINKNGIVKIIDFGSAVVYQYPFSNTLIESTGIVGSDPYLAPEVCVFNSYDPRPVDIWSTAMIYCCMILKKFPWKVPKLSDSSFKAFASREAGVTFGELLKRMPEPPSYDTTTGEEENVKSEVDIGVEIKIETETEIETKTEVDSKSKIQIEETEPQVIEAQEPDFKPSSVSTIEAEQPEGANHTSNLLGEARLLDALPAEVRPLIGNMVKLAPACRINVEECFEDSWLQMVQMCTLVDENCEPNIEGKLIPSNDHEHTQVDQSVAHIASLERNKKKKGRY